MREEWSHRPTSVHGLPGFASFLADRHAHAKLENLRPESCIRGFDLALTVLSPADAVPRTIPCLYLVPHSAVASATCTALPAAPTLSMKCLHHEAGLFTDVSHDAATGTRRRCVDQDEDAVRSNEDWRGRGNDGNWDALID